MCSTTIYLFILLQSNHFGGRPGYPVATEEEEDDREPVLSLSIREQRFSMSDTERDQRSLSSCLDGGDDDDRQQQQRQRHSLERNNIKAIMTHRTKSLDLEEIDFIRKRSKAINDLPPHLRHYCKVMEEDAKDESELQGLTEQEKRQRKKEKLTRIFGEKVCSAIIDKEAIAQMHASDSAAVGQGSSKAQKVLGDDVDVAQASHIVALADQPSHVRSYKVNWLLGERVLTQSEDSVVPEKEEDEFDKEKDERERRHRLHKKFGQRFDVDEVLYSEKMRLPLEEIERRAREKVDPETQPGNIRKDKINRFFGERITLDMDEKETGEGSSKYATEPQRLFKVKKLLGENIDVKAASESVSLAEQPSHIKSGKVNSLFGEKVLLDDYPKLVATPSALFDTLSKPVASSMVASSVGVSISVAGGVDTKEKKPKMKLQVSSFSHSHTNLSYELG